MDTLTTLDDETDVRLRLRLLDLADALRAEADLLLVRGCAS